MKNGRKNSSAKTMTQVRQCAVYTRKSTEKGLEQEFNSLDAQREACEQYVRSQAHLGWKLAEESYDDGGFTGANLERPAFTHMMQDVEAGKIDVVVVYKVDRLSRSLLDFAKMMERFNAAGASFVSVTQNFSTADAMGRLTLNMLMSFAEFEREMIGERTRDKMAAARRRGKWTGGPVPLGYDVIDKHLVVNDLEAVLVREIFDLYLEQRSTLAVARLLNNGKRATKRHQAVNGNLREAHEWTKDDVSRVLRNAIYAGYMPYGDELHEGEHKPIIDRETFTRARALLDAATTNHSAGNGRNPNYILRGVLFCARCGSAFTPASTRKGGCEYRYYRCVTREKQGRDACPSAPLPAKAIEDYVIERLREVTTSGEIAAAVADDVKTRVEAKRKDLLTERKKLPSEIATLSAEGKRLIETFRKVNSTGTKLVDQRIQEVGEQLSRCEARLAEVEREIANLYAVEVEAGWVARCLSDFNAVWDMLTPENRGRLVRAVVQRVEVDEPANKVNMFITDLGAGVSTADEHQPAQQKVSP